MSICYILKMKYGMLIFWVIIIVIIVAGMGASFFVKSQPGKYDQLAQCLKESGTVYYGAFWCPNCQAQNRIFGKSKPLLPYVECSTPDGKDQVQVCKDKHVTAYPTWEFPDGSRLAGVQQVLTLGEKSGCELPQ